MTAELNSLANDPDFVVEFAIGDPTPDLVPQDRGSGITFSNVYFDTPKRYLMKKAHMSKEDVRIFDTDTGKVVLISHHPGKNPYDSLDPLNLTNQDKRHSIAGGEWESLCNVTARGGGFQSFKIRPKTLTRHGRQYVQKKDGTNLMNVGKMGKLKSMSVRPHFVVGRSDKKEAYYTIVADMMGRTFTLTNEDDEVIAQVSKTTKALIKTAVFGSGSESTIDIAPGVDCSAILAIVYAIGQVGAHYVKDAFGNYLVEPLKESLTDSAIETAGLGAVKQSYVAASNDAHRNAHKLRRTAKFFNDNFFT